jgi:hypothetical protein
VQVPTNHAQKDTTMHATDTQPTAVTDLENLATELAAHGYQTILKSPPDSAPCLVVRNPRTSVLTETVHACDGSYWWSWKEPIAPCDQAATAAALLARVLRTTGK